MLTMPAQEIKRRGMSVMDDSLSHGPVYVVRNNKPKYVVMFAEEFDNLEEAFMEARVAASENDVRHGRVTRGSADELMSELTGV